MTGWSGLRTVCARAARVGGTRAGGWRGIWGGGRAACAFVRRAVATAAGRGPADPRGTGRGGRGKPAVGQSPGTRTARHRAQRRHSARTTGVLAECRGEVKGCLRGGSGRVRYAAPSSRGSSPLAIHAVPTPAPVPSSRTRAPAGRCAASSCPTAGSQESGKPAERARSVAAATRAGMVSCMTPSAYRPLHSHPPQCCARLAADAPGAVSQ